MKGREKRTIFVKVHPRARGRKLERIGADAYRVSVLSPPAHRKANKEVIEILASTFNLPKSAVKIIRGEKSRQKVVSLEDVNSEALAINHKAISVED